MKKLFTITTIFLFLAAFDINAQYKEKNYGETPDEIVPFGNFQNAYKRHFMEPQPFRGSGREKPEPTGLKSVKIGLLAPLENSKDKPKGIQMLQGTQLAFEQANAKGGYKGLPFELITRNDVGLWGAAANEVVYFDDQGAWTILGSLDDIVTHVAIRVGLKLEIPMVNMADPDPTLTETNIPWVMRVISDDRQSSYALANQIYRVDGLKKASLIRVNSRYGRVGTGEFKDASRRMGHPVGVEVRYAIGDTDFTEQIKTVKSSNADAIVLWGDANEVAMILNQLRKAGLNQPVYACDRAVSPEFLEIAGANANGVITTCQYNPKGDNPLYKKFRAEYIDRFKMEPDVFAVHAYDAANITIESIRKAGLNRVHIRDILLDLKTFQNYKGVSGEIVFDASWNDVGQIYMAEIRNNDFFFTPFTFKKETVTGSIK
jgi:branched-chain amino acid transport system substrate-binding protein